MLEVAVVGLGWWGQNVIGALADSDLVRVRVGVDPDPHSRERVERHGTRTVADLDAALADAGVDAVVLCTPHRLHVDQMVAAAAAGKHVFCEKPFSDSASEADRALEALSTAGVRVGIGHERRFEPAVQELRERVRSGDLGVPLVFEGNFSQDKFLALPPDNWRLSREHAPVGPLSATGIHLVDLAISVFGAPATVWAQLATRATGFANGDTLTITLTFVGGGTAVINAVLTTPFIGRVCVVGSQGWMEIRDRSHPESPSGWDVTTHHRGGTPEVRFFPPHPSVRANLEAFARSVLGEADYPVTLEEIRSNVRAFAAITRSVETGAIETV
ncbi:Gfo/Idh/MocA family protein [Nocardioides mesophilus]|uniref:Gfo/Idh/MocA family oxidoreductase n=1 Tax=Nocardioides mesophilus TaxID=433659 RepID=A0A7G9RG52_9ACTN|nr:Gfo/Idh/MocA family oxidoreductase [Nocardioides mesophilus]QNN54577.1 Gfo/Idh/MocA family oxidoreductase [Nocardioides mesophilus]